VPSDENRIAEMAEHVSYEAFMLSGTLQLIDQDFPPAEKVHETVRTVVRNALFESSLMHVRVLEDFLTLAAPSQPDDVIATDFLPSWDRRRCLSTAERSYVNKRIMHLTTVRGEGPAPWQLEKSREVFRRFRLFLETLRSTDPQKVDWFDPWIELAPRSDP
jgi:hypothetical protein